MKRWRKILLYCISAFAGAFVVFALVERFRGETALSRYLKQLQLQGEAINVEAHLPQPVEGRDNGLLVLRALTNYTDELRPVNQLIPPLRRIDSPGYAKASWMLDSWKDEEGNRVTWSEFDEKLDQNTNALTIIKETLAKPNFGLGVDYTKGFVDFDTQPISHLVGIKSATQLLAALTASAIRRGDYGKGMEHQLLSAYLVHMLRNERYIIAQLVRIACAHIALRATWELLQCDYPPEDRLSKLHDLWSKQDFIADMGASLEMERAMTWRTFEQLRSSSDQIVAYMRSRDEGMTWVEGYVSADDSLLKWMARRCGYIPFWKFAWSAQDADHGLHWWQAIIDLHRQAGRQSLAKVNEAMESLDASAGESWFVQAFEGEWNQNFYDRCRYLVSTDSTALTTMIITKVFLATAEARLAVIAVALARYRFQVGRYPGKLSELVPGYLSGIPKDPVSGLSFYYRLQPDKTFLLYSAGVDGKDNAGDAKEQEINDVYSGIWRGHDAVWPRLVQSPSQSADAATEK